MSQGYNVFWGDTHHNSYQHYVQDPPLADVLAFASTYLTFQTSEDDATYRDLYDDAGNEYTVTAAASRAIVVNPVDFYSCKFVKVRSGTSGTPVNQGASRELVERYGTLVALALNRLTYGRDVVVPLYGDWLWILPVAEAALGRALEQAREALRAAVQPEYRMRLHDEVTLVMYTRAFAQVLIRCCSGVRCLAQAECLAGPGIASLLRQEAANWSAKMEESWQ